VTTADSPIGEAAELLHARIGDRVRHDAPLADMTTYRVGGSAALFVDAAGVDDLRAVADAKARTGLPTLVVGRGSNMLVADSGFTGIALSVGSFADHIEIGRADDEQSCVVRAGGAVPLPVLARRTAAAAVTGFEWAVGVPGSIGGAVRMNAGGHGSDMAACLVDIDVFDLDVPDRCDVHDLVTIDAADLGLRFRASSLAANHVVIEARLALRTGDRARCEAEIAEIVRWRREHQPGGQNCGSVFVNPVPGEVTAGGLIDQLGLRGLRIGSAWVSEKHANFVQAGESGRAADVRAVIEEVRARVADATGFRLRSEVRLVGFDDVEPMSFDAASNSSGADGEHGGPIPGE
jgi:UDP-N-acetylmuramate dehydrogenase